MMKNISSFPCVPGLPDLAIRNLFCIGRNFAEHAKELGNAVPSEPVVFLKPSSSVLISGGDIVLPAMSERVDHEVELVVAIGADASRVSETQALSCVAGIGVGIDITARDLQDQAKKKALPWAVAKGFDTFAVLGDFVPFQAEGSEWERLQLGLSVNGEPRQAGRVGDMLFSVPRLIAWLSQVYHLKAGDLIYTGTPPGVAPLRYGDRMVAELLTGDGAVLSRAEVGVRGR
jgi:2-keto-4-pentenoate hydratase/2-oxohepta-3-ene-1,7-dioic acid hydratase in catechol pathway